MPLPPRTDVRLDVSILFLPCLLRKETSGRTSVQDIKRALFLARMKNPKNKCCDKCPLSHNLTDSLNRVMNVGLNEVMNMGLNRE